MSKTIHRRWFALAVLAVVAAAAFVAGSGSVGHTSSHIIAVVNGESIEKDEFIAQLIAREGQGVLDAMIRERLLVQETEKAGVHVGSEPVDSEMETIRGRFESQEDFSAALRQAGHTEASLRSDIELELRLRTLLKDQIKVTEDDLRQAYTQYESQLGGASFEEVRDQLVNVVSQDKFSQATGQWLERKIAESDIETFLERATN